MATIIERTKQPLRASEFNAPKSIDPSPKIIYGSDINAEREIKEATHAAQIAKVKYLTAMMKEQVAQRREKRYAEDDKKLQGAVDQDRIDRLRDAATLKRRMFEGDTTAPYQMTEGGYPVAAGLNPKAGYGPYPMESEEGRTQYDKLRGDEFSLLGIKEPTSQPYGQTKAGVEATIKGAENVAKIGAEAKKRPEITMKDLMELELKKSAQGLKIHEMATKYAQNATMTGTGGPDNKEAFDAAYTEYVKKLTGQGGGEGKQLDPGTAKGFLQQAGGDKNKAREMARAEGYVF